MSLKLNSESERERAIEYRQTDNDLRLFDSLNVVVVVVIVVDYD